MFSVPRPRGPQCHGRSIRALQPRFSQNFPCVSDNIASVAFHIWRYTESLKDLAFIFWRFCSAPLCLSMAASKNPNYQEQFCRCRPLFLLHFIFSNFSYKLSSLSFFSFLDSRAKHLMSLIAYMSECCEKC